MGWARIRWGCGHEGRKQMYGSYASRESRIAFEAGRKCLACWLIEKWISEGDYRASNPDRFALAAAIARGKGIQIYADEASSSSGEMAGR